MSEVSGIMVGIIVFLAITTFSLLMTLITEPNYSDGFCAARGGGAITSDYCDVEGKVVTVER